MAAESTVSALSSGQGGATGWQEDVDTVRGTVLGRDVNRDNDSDSLSSVSVAIWQ